MQSRDPFSGDCDDAVEHHHHGYILVHPLQSRDPFSGDCNLGAPPTEPPRARSQLAEPRPVLRGLRPARRREGASGGKMTMSCRAETRSQRIATVAQLRAQGEQPLGACRAETRSQGIATTSCAVIFSYLRVMILQSRDPFSGDCDGLISGEDPTAPGRAPCRAETRSQGIVTGSSDVDPPDDPHLAEPRPVLRGLRL